VAQPYGGRSDSRRSSDFDYVSCDLPARRRRITAFTVIARGFAGDQFEKKFWILEEI
jgi:hypothetical protein